MTELVKYRARIGFNYRPHPKERVEVRVDEDDVVSLPADVVKALPAGALEKVKA